MPRLRILVPLLAVLAGASCAQLGDPPEAPAESTATPSPDTAATSAALEREGRGPRGWRRGPPPGALEACASASEGDACSVSFGGEAHAGTCVTPRRGGDDGRLVCRPADMPRGGRRGHGRHHGPGGPGGPGDHDAPGEADG